MNEISIEKNGVLYTAYYEIFDDTLVVTLPDGSQREIELRMLKPESAVMAHLRSYVNNV
jgi:hypothetical protein